MDIVYHDLSRMYEVKNFIEEWSNSADYIHVKTSGSTGEPQSLRLAKSFMKKSAERTLSYFNLTSGMKAGLCLSLSSIAGKMMVIRSILAEMELHVLPLNNNPLQNLSVDLDFNAIVPVQAMNYLKASPTLSQKGVVLIGGAPLSERQLKRIGGIFPRAYQTYGMTETASHIALRKISNGAQEPYRVLDGITVSVEEGCLVIHCNDLVGGFIQTNDCAQMLDGKSFHILGRKDFVINSGGIKINPESVESRLSNLLNEPCIVVPIPDETWGELVGLVLVKNRSIPTIDELKRHFVSSEMPRKYTIVSEILLTENGKIDRIKMQQKICDHEWQELL